MDNTTETKNSKDAFLEYLNTEVEQIREDIKTPGWTQWAIIGALASISWLIILEIEKNIFDFNQMLMQFAILSIVAGLIRYIYDLTKPKQTGKKTQFTSIPEIFSGKVLSYIFSLIYMLIIVLIVVYLFSGANQYLYYSIVLCYSSVFLFLPILYLIPQFFRKYTRGELYFPSCQGS